MKWLFWPFARIPVSFALLVLVTGSALFGYRASVATWKSSLQDVDQYDSAPGCDKYAAHVDKGLPPCVSVPMVVVGKTSHTEPSDVNVSGTRLALDLAIRDPKGRVTEYRDVYDNFWNDIQTGQTIKEVTWEGRVEELDSRNEYYPVLSRSPRTSRLLGVLLACIVIGFLSFGFLLEIWFPRRRLFGFLYLRFLP